MVISGMPITRGWIKTKTRFRRDKFVTSRQPYLASINWWTRLEYWIPSMVYRPGAADSPC